MSVGKATRPRVFGVVAVLFALVAVFMAPVFVGTASAHSQLIQGDPRDGTLIKKAPAAITLTFNEDLQNLPGSKSNQIVVLDRDGNEVTHGDIKIDGPKLIRPLHKLPKGTYDVQWSALSADGHRVSGDGNYAFTVTEGEASDLKPSASSSAAQKPAQANTAPAAQSSQSSEQASKTDDDPANTKTLMWIVGGFLVLAIILGIILQVTRKKTPKQH